MRIAMVVTTYNKKRTWLSFRVGGFSFLFFFSLYFLRVGGFSGSARERNVDGFWRSGKGKKEKILHICYYCLRPPEITAHLI